MLLLLVAGTLIAGCSPSENVVDVTTDALSFNSEYAGNTSSLTWAQNSKIGIFEKKSGQTLSESSIVDGLSNIPYQTIGNGIFTHTTRPLTYPQDGSAVDFIAYAPFSDTLRSYQISVDVSQQTGNPWLNLLASNNIVARTNTKQPTLRFKRALGKVTLTINSTDGGDISGLAATLFDMPTSGTFDLRNNTMTVTAPRNGTIPMTMTGSKFTRTATAYVLPQQLQALKVRFTAANGLVREVTLSPSVTVNSDNALKQDVTISGLGSTTTVVAGKQHWTETPLITPPTEQQCEPALYRALLRSQWPELSQLCYALRHGPQDGLLGGLSALHFLYAAQHRAYGCLGLRPLALNGTTAHDEECNRAVSAWPPDTERRPLCDKRS